MSVILGKRSRLTDEEIETYVRNDKRLRVKNSTPVCDLVELMSTSKDDNLRRLSLLFPHLDRVYLENVLLNASFNFEKAIQVLTQEHNLLTIIPNPRIYATQIVSHLQNVKSGEEAVNLTTSAFQSIGTETQQAVGKNPIQQNEALKSALTQISKENSILKKAILKMKYKLDDLYRIPTDELRKQIQQEKQIKYELLLKLSQIQKSNTIMEWSQHVF